MNKTTFDEQLTKLVSGLEYKEKAFIETLKITILNKYRLKEKELGEFSVAVGANVAELEAEKAQKIEAYTSTKNEVIRADLEKKIDELHAQIEQTRVQRNGIEIKENDVHDFVAYVKYLMEHPVETLVTQKNMSALKGLFSIVFDELPTYEEIVSGTPKLSLPYKLSEEYRRTKSLSVPPHEIEPNDALRR